MRHIDIALEFVELHKHGDPDTWQPMSVFGEEKLGIIWDKLIGGSYGSITSSDGINHEIEIPGIERRDGNPFLFDFTT